MAKLGYRPVGIVVLMFLVTAMLYNSQLYSGHISKLFDTPSPAPSDLTIQDGATNAVMLMLARNNELEGAVSSVRQLEEKFNRRYHYPWVFLNDEPFTEDFKQQVAAVTNSNVSFGLIPPEDWNQPDWIDEEKAKAGREALVKQSIIYGESVSYRNMCRFQSRAFYKHELVLPYRWYWRVEPHVSFHCDMDFDPFAYLHNNNKVYGFNIAVYEWMQTIPSLWPTVKEFVKLNPQYIAPNNSIGFISDDDGSSFNGCHYWSNMEIADMEFWRGEAYSAYVDYLESTGGFYYERWGDAPVHTMAVSLFLPKDKIHFFDQIGYTHEPHTHCPQDLDFLLGSCKCHIGLSIDWRDWSCYPRWHVMQGRTYSVAHASVIST